MVMAALAGLVPGGIEGIFGVIDQIIPGPAGRGIGAYLPGRSTPAALRSQRAGGVRGQSGGASAELVGQWNTGTATFYRLANGKIGTVKRNGVWKEWRPYRPVVIPRKWNTRSMGRVARSLERQKKTAMQIVELGGGTAYSGRPPAKRK